MHTKAQVQAQAQAYVCYTAVHKIALMFGQFCSRHNSMNIATLTMHTFE